MNETERARQCVQTVAGSRQPPPPPEVVEVATSLTVEFWAVLDRLEVDPDTYGRAVMVPRAALDLVLARERKAKREARRAANRAEHADRIQERGW